MTHIWRKEYKDRSRILDKFYTKQEVVKRCLDEVNKLIFLKSTQKSVSIYGLSIRGYENAKKY